MRSSREARRQVLVAGIAALLTLLARPGFADRAQRLFVMARSKNSNVVHYDVRFDGRGGLDKKEPLNAYWVLHEQAGRREELSWLERRLAYGWEVVSAARGEVVLRLTAFKQRPLRVVPRGGRYRALVRISGKASYLDKIFVTSAESGLVPRVLSVELFGSDAVSGAPLYERITND
jgi:hypothetical protein